MYYQQCTKGTTLIRTGETPDKFYVILSGEVIVIKQRDQTRLENENSLVFKLRQMIRELYLDNILPGDKIKIKHLPLSRYDISSDKDLDIINNWSYSKN